MGDGACIGYLTSGGYGHALGGSVGLGYVKHADAINQAWLDDREWGIDVGGTVFSARASLRALYDPSGERMRGDGQL